MVKLIYFTKTYVTVNCDECQIYPTKALCSIYSNGGAEKNAFEVSTPTTKR